jgi:hypothetical protein
MQAGSKRCSIRTRLGNLDMDIGDLWGYVFSFASGKSEIFVPQSGQKKKGLPD